MLGKGNIVSGILYVVANSIGRIDEVTPRALEVLSQVDIVAAEDTRTTGFMLHLSGVKVNKFTAYHKHNEGQKHKALITRLLAGQSVAIVSEAGTPCISDPGYLLVKAAVDAGIPVVGVSWPCAAITALSISALPAEPFMFVGFLPKKPTELINTIRHFDITVIFYESPKRIMATVSLLTEHFPESSLCLCNDLTKKFEQIYRGDPKSVLKALQENPDLEKGEYTGLLFMSAPSNEIAKEEPPSLESQLVDIIVKSQSTLSVKDAIKILSKKHPKNEVYEASLRLKELL